MSDDSSTNTKSDPGSRPSLKTKLLVLSSSLLAIHKTLFETQMADVERARGGAAIPPGEKLRMLLGDPDFQWLRPLSQLMTAVDETIFQKEPITDEQVDALHKSLQELFFEESEGDAADGPSFLARSASTVAREPRLRAELQSLKLALGIGEH